MLIGQGLVGDSYSQVPPSKGAKSITLTSVAVSITVGKGVKSLSTEQHTINGTNEQLKSLYTHMISTSNYIKAEQSPGSTVTFIYPNDTAKVYHGASANAQAFTSWFDAFLKHMDNSHITKDKARWIIVIVCDDSGCVKQTSHV
jgi:hypothetical protein